MAKKVKHMEEVIEWKRGRFPKAADDRRTLRNPTDIVPLWWPIALYHEAPMVAHRALRVKYTASIENRIKPLIVDFGSIGGKKSLLLS